MMINFFIRRSRLMMMRILVFKLKVENREY